LKVATQNIRCKPPMPEPHVKHDVQATAKEATLIGWQEIGTETYKEQIGNLAPTFQSYIPSSQPVSWVLRNWEVVDKGRYMLHRAKPGVHASRWIVWVLFRHKKSKRLMIFHNTHYIAHAKAGRPGSAKYRSEVWEAGNQRHRNLIDLWVRKGYAVIGTGDFNKRLTPVVGVEVRGKRVRYLTPPNVIDKIFCIDGRGSHFDATSSIVLTPRYSDHVGRMAIIKLRSGQS